MLIEFFFYISSSFGYPDEGYLSRVQKELADVGVTGESLFDVHWRFIHDPTLFPRNYDFSSYFNTRESAV
jgi:hypothetical protein